MMPRTDRAIKTPNLRIPLSLGCLVALLLFASDISWSRSENRVRIPNVVKKTERAPERPLVFSAELRSPKGATAPVQDPVDESAEASTYDIPAVNAASFDGDVRDLIPVPTNLDQRSIDYESRLQELETPVGGMEKSSRSHEPGLPILMAPAPAPIRSFNGLSRTEPVTGGQAGAGTPPDTNGDVGPNHFIISVNDAYGIYDKATGTRLAAFTENSLFSSGSRPGGGTGTGTLCDTNTFGDPVVIYDQLADRWILTNLAFVLNTTTGLWVPPVFQCFAASKTGDPVMGGWWVYAVRIDTGGAGLPPVGTLDDYPKFGNWNDGCLYMGANAFNSSGNSSGAIFGSFNKNDMYNGLTLRGSLGISAAIGTSLFPSNLLGRAPNQMPPSGTPDFFVRNASTTSFQVRRFTPGANCGGGGTLSAATTVSHASGPTPGTNIVLQPNDTPAANTHALDSLGDRIMQKVQYRKVGSAESVWVVHTVRPAGAATAPQWAQIDVSGGTVATTPVQQQIYQPDTTLFRWMGGLATDTAGNMALGYSTSNGTAPNFPSIAYSGRLASDPLGTLPQTERQLIAGAGSQIFNCGGGPCHRWGDYSSMSIDVDDCTFWYTTEYYDTQANGNTGNWHTRIGSFKYPSCVPVTPVITCPPNITVSNDPNSCGAVVNFTGANAATATGNPTPTITYSPPSGSVFPIGTTTVTATATNSLGSASCTFTVTVNDNQNPTIACPANITVPNDPGQCGAVVTFAPTPSDNCPGATTTCAPASGTSFSIGTTTVTCHATDASGNTSANCSFTVTVNDTENPTISCPANIVRSTDPGVCTAVVTFVVTASDNCPGVTVVSSPPSGSVFPKGTTTVMNTATDASGNTATCSFTVTINDTEPPSVTAITVATSSLSPPDHNLINVGLAGGNFSDNCPGATRQVLVFGDEDDEAETGDGNFSPDARDLNIGTLRLRSERIGAADGRVYLIVVKVTDTSGNMSFTCATVVVPKSQSKGDKNSVDAQAAAAKAYALSHNGSPPPGYFVIGDGQVVGPKQ
ncbi:MAG TPA: HYR domain-containing protein [Blastocatellia bacterium]|nr:HYR domain-containing protein [Blastocatellia bacterium]